MQEEKFDISIIIPVFNGEIFVKKCLDTLLIQKNIANCEIIFVNDGSTDKSISIIEEYNKKNIKILSLPSNSGPAASRNLGIKNSDGEYVFFCDIDDLIDQNALQILYNTAKKNNCEYVFSDFKKFEGDKNQRIGVYNYEKDKSFRNKEIVEAMKRELHDASLGHLGLFGCNGRLIKRSLLIDKKIFFNEELRWMEDKTFGWNVLSFVREAIYIRKQLYSYYFHPSIKTNVTESLNRGSSIKYIKLILNQVQKSLELRGVETQMINILKKRGLMFFSIQALVSLSNQIFLNKIDKQSGKEIRRRLIESIYNDKEIIQSINGYKCTKSESKWIPKAMSLKSTFLLEIACDLRARDIANERRRNKK